MRTQGRFFYTAASSDVPFSLISPDEMSTKSQQQMQPPINLSRMKMQLRSTSQKNSSCLLVNMFLQGTKKTQTCINAFCEFVVRHFHILKQNFIENFIYLKTSKQRRISLWSQIVDLIHMLVFLDAQKSKQIPQNGDHLPIEMLNCLNNSLIKFVFHYTKSDGDKIKLTSLKIIFLDFNVGSKISGIKTSKAVLYCSQLKTFKDCMIQSFCRLTIPSAS